MNVSGLVPREVALESLVLVSLTILFQLAMIHYSSEGDAKITSSYRRDHRQQHSFRDFNISDFNFFRQHLSSGVVPFRHWGCGVLCVVLCVVGCVVCGVVSGFGV